MRFERLDLDGVLELVPRRFGDERGFFSETYSKHSFLKAGLDIEWVQDNHSRSEEQGVLRGLHFQVAPFAQDKLIRVLRGSIFDVAVDLRVDSPTFGRWTSRILSASDWNQLLVPKGFAHGFRTLEPGVEVAYKVSAPYSPQHDRAIRWNDPAIGVAWPLKGRQPILSAKDRDAPLLSDLAGNFAFTNPEPSP
jgi:dTDP-4-dehydrorhamnose 3,5-epimerase